MFFVEGGHSPDGDDFQNCFAKLIKDLPNYEDTPPPPDGNDDFDMTHLVAGGKEANQDLCVDIQVVRKDSNDENGSRYKGVIVDEINTENGNFVIRYHSPKSGEDLLYLYFQGGRWHADGKNSLQLSPLFTPKELLKSVLTAAAGRFADLVDCDERIGEDGWFLLW